MKNDLLLFELDIKGASLIPMRKHNNSKEFKQLPVEFAAWTNSKDEIFINLDRLKSDPGYKIGDLYDNTKLP